VIFEDLWGDVVKREPEVMHVCVYGCVTMCAHIYSCHAEFRVFICEKERDYA